MFKHLPKIILISFSGQATLLALLIASAVAIVTAVGVTTRQNSSLRRSTYTAQTDQAFSCANSGVDAALLEIKNKEAAGLSTVGLNGTGNFNANQGVCNYSYTTTDLNTYPIVIKTMNKDQVQEFNIAGASGVTFNFGNVDLSKASAIEVTHAYLGSTGYEMRKYAYKCGPGSIPGVSLSNFMDMGNSATTCEVSSIPSISSSHTSAILRIRPVASTIKIDFTVSGTSPSQGIKVNSTGTAGGVVRNIEVLRMNPQLPAIFDYVLYSEEGSIQK